MLYISSISGRLSCNTKFSRQYLLQDTECKLGGSLAKGRWRSESRSKHFQRQCSTGRTLRNHDNSVKSPILALVRTVMLQVLEELANAA